MKKLLAIIFSASVLLFMNACTKTDFDDKEYKTPVYTGEAANTSMDNLKTIYTTAFPTTEDRLTEDQFVVIKEDLIIEGYVVSDDKQGSFYKNLVIQDKATNPTQGILIQLGENSLYTKFALGQKIFVNCKGLTLGKYGGEVQLGGGKLEYKQREWRIAPIGALSISKHLFKDGDLVKITPAIKTIDELTASDRFTYITIKNVQFDEASKNQTLGNINADHSNAFPFKSNTLVDEKGNTMVVFTSDYSKFAHKRTPNGSGSITGVLSAHKGSNQFVLNSFEDVKIETVVDNTVYDFNLNLDGVADKTNFAQEGWINFSEKGKNTWFVQKEKFTENMYVGASNYNTGADMLSWIISPEIDATEQKTMSIKTAMHHWNHATGESPIQFFYSEDFNGTDVLSATWKVLTIDNIADSSSKDWAWVNSEKIELPKGNKIHIAIKYSATAEKTSAYLLDNFKVYKK